MCNCIRTNIFITNMSREQSAHVYHKGGLDCGSRNSTGLLAGRVVKETGRQFWVSSSLRQQPKHSVVFCGARMDSVLISQPSLRILHVRETGIRLGSHLMFSAVLCYLLLIQCLCTSAFSCEQAQGKLKREQEVRKDGLMSVCLERDNSFIAMDTWFLKNCSVVGKWEISRKQKQATLQRFQPSSSAGARGVLIGLLCMEIFY